MAANKSFSGQPQRQVSVTVKLIEVITISDDEDNQEDETYTVQSSLDPHTSQDPNIPTPLSASFTNTQEMSPRKSCIVQKRESVVRKLIETIDISDDEDDQPINTVSRTSPESQKLSSSSRSHQTPTCLISWKKRNINFGKKLFSGMKDQSEDLNVTPLHKSDIPRNPECASISPETVRKPESIMKCHINQRNISASDGITIHINSALNKVNLDESDDEPEKSADAALNTTDTAHPKATKDKAQNEENNDEPASPKMLLNSKGAVANSSKKRSKRLERFHATDQRQVEMSPIGMVGYVSVPVEKSAGSAHFPAEIAPISRKKPSRLLVKDAVNAKIQKQKTRPTHKMGLRKTTSKNRPTQKQHSERSGHDSRASCIVYTRKSLRRDQNQDEQRVGRALKPHDKNLIRKTADSGRLYYICIFCKKTFQDHSEGRVHVRIHTGDKPYKCSRCGKGFSRNFTLKLHQNLHADNHQFKCNFCTKIFLHWCSHRKHQNICANKKN